MFYLVTGVFSLLAGLYYLRLALLGRNPENLSTAVGTLVKVSGFKNVPMKHGGIIKNQTDYAYAYTVKGRTYRLKGRVNAHRRTLLRKATIVFVTGHPRRAYIDQFTGIVEWAIAFCFFGLGVYLFWIFSLV